VALYTGEVKTTQQVFQQRRDNKADDGGYLMRVGFAPGSGEGEQGIVWVDAQADSSVLARYINDARLPLAYNVEFRKRPEHRDAEVVALRDIVEGEELFVDYGVAYWRGVTYEASKMKALQLGELYVRTSEASAKEVLFCGERAKRAQRKASSSAAETGSLSEREGGALLRRASEASAKGRRLLLRRAAEAGYFGGCRGRPPEPPLRPAMLRMCSAAHMLGCAWAPGRPQLTLPSCSLRSQVLQARRRRRLPGVRRAVPVRAGDVRAGRATESRGDGEVGARA
jgi:hypothetical protein